MAVDPVPELRQVMNLGPHNVAKLNKSAYGLVDAPFLWFCSSVTELTRLGFEASPFDPCLLVLREPAHSDRAGSLAGFLGVHVDDEIGGGNALYVSMSKRSRSWKRNSSSDPTKPVHLLSPGLKSPKEAITAFT